MSIEIPVELGPSLLFIAFAFLLSFILETAPKLKDWWSQTPYKLLVLLVGLIGIALAFWSIHCFTAITVWPTPTQECGWNGFAITMAVALFAFTANQTAFATKTRTYQNAVERQPPTPIDLPYDFD